MPRRINSHRVFRVGLMVVAFAIVAAQCTPHEDNATVPTIQQTESPTAIPTTTIVIPPTDTLIPITPTPSVESLCDHPYLPLRLGATWSYEYVDGDRGTSEVKSYKVIEFTQESRSSYPEVGIWAVIESSEVFSDGPGHDWIACTSSRIYAPHNPSGRYSPFGLALLPADQLVPNATWSARTPGTGIDWSGCRGVGKNNVDEYTPNYTLVSGMETTKVGAGEFTTIAISYSIVHDLSIPILDLADTGGCGPASYYTSGTFWLAEHVGVVKVVERFLRQDGTEFENTFSLTSYGVP